MYLKLRHRRLDSESDSSMTENATDITRNGNGMRARSKDKTPQEARCGSNQSSHSDFYSGLASTESGCKKTPDEYQALCESSDDSLTGRDARSTCDISPERRQTSYATMRLKQSEDQADDSQAVHPLKGAGLRCNGMAALNYIIEVSIRLLLLAAFIHLEQITPFKRVIHPEEVWLYKNPVVKEYISALAVLNAVVFGPTVLILLILFVNRNKRDAARAGWAFTLAVSLNGFLTSLLKVTVGRPRPDFFYRCYPDGAAIGDFMNCTGDVRTVNEGRKSFPSGHASMAFASFGFMFFYLSSRLHIFNDRGRGSSWRLLVSIAPLVAAVVVAISRTCDYRHHWQDVSFGSVLGFCVSYLCYRQYFPSIFSRNCHRSYASSQRIIINQVDIQQPVNGTHESGENSPLINANGNDKWI